MRSDEISDSGGRDPSWSSRLQGLLPSKLSHKAVAVVGCGSVGSYIADELCRAGIRKFVLVDPDVIEWPNLTRTVYGQEDVGSFKVEALGRHLKRIFFDTVIYPYPVELQALRPKIRDVFADVQLVIAAVDDPRANGILDRFCYALEIPSLFIGIYRGAKGGEVIAIDPDVTPCFGCATGGVRDSLADVIDRQGVVRQRDYGTNKLVAEVGIGADIHFVCAAAVKMALSLMSKADLDAPIGRFIDGQLREGAHYVMFGTEPNYYLFPSTHSNAIGQYAFQSLWLKTSRKEDCPRCGELPGRISPFDEQ